MKLLKARASFLISTLCLLCVGFGSVAPAGAAQNWQVKDPHAFDAREDKLVNDVIVSAVRKGNGLEVESVAPSSLFRAVPPLGAATKKTLVPYQEFSLYNTHGFVRYKVMDFGKDGLNVRFYNCFNLNTVDSATPHIQSGSFIIRFKAPMKTTQTAKKIFSNAKSV